jgi:hypothetical protein
MRNGTPAEAGIPFERGMSWREGTSHLCDGDDCGGTTVTTFNPASAPDYSRTARAVRTVPRTLPRNLPRNRTDPAVPVERRRHIATLGWRR